MRKGFTLVEMLVVVGVLGLLMGLLFPVVNRAREQGRKTACMNNLRQIGVALHGYVSDSKGRLPLAARIGEGSDDPTSITNILALPEKQLFHCPADGQPQPRAEYNGKSCFDRYGTSYEWNALMVNGKLIDDLTTSVTGVVIVPPVMYDAEEFHGKLDRNYLFPDGRVTRNRKEF